MRWFVDPDFDFDSVSSAVSIIALFFVSVELRLTCFALVAAAQVLHVAKHFRNTLVIQY